LHPRYSVNGSS
jgi:threonine dehydratase